MPIFRALSWSVLLARDSSQLPRVATFEQVLVTAPPSDSESIERSRGVESEPRQCYSERMRGENVEKPNGNPIAGVDRWTMYVARFATDPQ
jgi:hypothetical protein